jgi:hypothetical protein
MNANSGRIAPLPAAVLIALFLVSPALRAADTGEIPPWSLALEQRLQPWCPADCATVVPFTATYTSKDRTLVFVGAHHVFTAANSTTRAIDAGFAASSPAILIAEGFPTAMGESPAPLVKHAGRRGTAEEDRFTRSEMMYALSLVIGRGIPFIGGEPTFEEQRRALEARGFSQADIAFAYLLGMLSQSVRSGDLAGAGDLRLAESYAQAAQGLADQYQLRAPSVADFSARYRVMFGVEAAEDAHFVSRSDPGTDSPVARLNRARMVIRDEHLLKTIESEMDSKRRVLIVFGGSHWTTLSKALQKRYGKPEITPFLD